jgi:predicted DNA-binding protein YlxM (UPF0122 family)
LSPEEIHAFNEVSSPSLMNGGGHDEAFLTIPPQWVDDPNNPHARPETVDRWNALVRTYGGARMREAIDQYAPLTNEQREVLRMFLDGLTRKEIGALREVSRQAVHKVVWAAIRALRRYFARFPQVRAVKPHEATEDRHEATEDRHEATEDRHEAGAQRASGRTEETRAKVSHAA